MAYRKADNCGPVPYPDQSGRFLGDSEVVENDEANDWSPYVALGYIVETGAAATPDKKESKEELAKAVEPLPAPPPAPKKTVGELAKEAAASSSDEGAKTVASAAKSAAKSRKKKKKKKAEVSDGSDTADERGTAEEVDSSATRESSS
jgi:hypothetical protein